MTRDTLAPGVAALARALETTGVIDDPPRKWEDRHDAGGRLAMSIGWPDYPEVARRILDVLGTPELINREAGVPATDAVNRGTPGARPATEVATPPGAALATPVTPEGGT